MAEWVGRVSGAPADHDVAIVGAGVVGSAIARELSHFRLRLLLLEAGNDVGAATSKANTALLHTGFDAKPGTLEARLVRRGHELLSAYAPRAGIPLERVGALLVAWSEEEYARFPAIVGQARANGYDAIAEIPAEELYRRIPALGPGAKAALEVPDEGIVCTFTTPLAFATEAVLGGCELRRGCRVDAVRRTPGGGFELDTTGGPVRARFLVNAAGLFSDELDRMLGHDGFTVTPRRGQLVVFDKLAGPLLGHILLAVPSETTKGVLLAPTVYGNLLLGPTAEDVSDKRDTSTTAAGLAHLMSEGRRLDAGARAPGGDGAVRRAAGGDRALRLPARDLGGGGLRARRWDPLHRAVGLDGDRRARARAARGRGAGARAARAPCGGPHAEHRRALPAALRAARR